MNNRFQDQVAIVTGGADGLGKAMSRRIAAEGGRVVVFDWSDENRAKAEAEFSADNLDIACIKVDISQRDQVQTAIAEAVAEHAQLDIMINCAAIVGPTSTNIIDYDDDAYDDVCRVNLRGTYLMTKYALAPMLERDYGRILLVASIAGKEGNPGMIGYSSTKAAVLGVVKAAGKEYSETGVTVNGLAPAVIQTAMVDECDAETVKYMTSRIPMNRTGTLDEVAAMGAFIVSKECSFCTGFIFDLTGGRATY